MTADRLHPGLVHHIVNTLGWPALRPLQEDAIEPILDRHDVLLLAPTAGGKTEAATFPLLTAMTNENWQGLSVLYVCPLRALLNNLHPRLSSYAEWMGRTAGLWHGDTGVTQRRRLLSDRPDILLTTPESLEAMLVSTKVDPRLQFAELRAVIVDEVHAFAGDDRGWHLLAVLERLQRLAGRPLQRIGLSATVGNPDQLLAWLQGSGAETRPRTVVVPQSSGAVVPEIGLDYVGSVDNAATVIEQLHRGEKRLVFAESRRKVEALGQALRTRGVETFVSHSSLAIDERRRAEAAFAESRDCVIVSTSTLELGIDVGDLDRVIQIDAPATVASFLQRLGRTGRREGASRNTLFLATDQESLLLAAALLHLWGRGFVEPVVAPLLPRHIVAQQLLGLCLQEGRVGEAVWDQWWAGLSLFDETAPEIVKWLVSSGHLESDDGMLFIGPEAERRYGRRNFMELLSVFVANPQVTVLHGRSEIGTIDPMVLTQKVEGPRVFSLAGRAWKSTYVDWKRKKCFVEPSEIPGSSRWTSIPQPNSYALSRAQREVLLGAEPLVTISKRAESSLREIREVRADQVWADGNTIVRTASGPSLWTFAGARANATLAVALHDVVEPAARYDNQRLLLRSDANPAAVGEAVREAAGSPMPAPETSPEAVRELKFSEVLPPGLAESTLAARLLDDVGARQIIGEHMRWITVE